MTLPPRTLDTMSDAIAFASPNGRMSKRARNAALKRIHDKLFGGMTREDWTGGATPQPSEKERDLRHAARLRDLANRGMCIRKYNKLAAELEAKWEGK